MDLPTSATPRTTSADALSIHPDSIRVSSNAAAGEFARHLADHGRANDQARRDDRLAERRERPDATERSRRDEDARERNATDSQETKARDKEANSAGEGEMATEAEGAVEIAVTVESDLQPAMASEDTAAAPTLESTSDLQVAEPEPNLAVEASVIDVAPSEVPDEVVEAAMPALNDDGAQTEAAVPSDKAATAVPTVPVADATAQKQAPQTAGNGEAQQTASTTKEPVNLPLRPTTGPQQAVIDAASTEQAVDPDTVAAAAVAKAGAKPLKGLGQETAEAFAGKKADAKQAAASAAAAPQAAPIQQAMRNAGTPPQTAPINVTPAEIQPAPRGGEIPSSMQPASNAATVRIGTLPGQSQPTQVPAMAIALQMARNLQKGTNRFEIRLDPPEMGRIDVRMEVRRDGHVTAHLTVEKPETLDLLQRDARALQQALNNAGLDADENSLNFSLRDETADESRHDISGNDRDGENADDVEASAAPIYNVNLSATGGIDIRV